MTGILHGLAMLRGLWAVAAALLVGAGLIVAAGADPIEAYLALFEGAFVDYWGLASTLTKACPLILCGLAVALPLRAGLFNIGAEGQLYMGALAGTLVALLVPGLPGPVHILLCVLAGAAGGALWALIPALLRAYQNVNELITTLLLNFVALHFTGFIVSGPLEEPGAPYPYSPEIPVSTMLPVLLPRTDAHIGLVVAVVLAIVIFLAFRRSTAGRSLAIIGQNVQAARYAGIPVRRTMIVAFLVAGAMAGMAGIFEVLGFRFRLFHAFSPGYGYDGIVVAFLAGLSPLLTVVSGLFLAGLRSGAGALQRAVGVETTVVEAIQGLVILFVAVGLAVQIRNATRSKAMPPAAEPAADEPRP